MVNKDTKHKILKLAVDKVKMYDSSHKTSGMESTSGNNYPTLYIDLKEAPFLKDYEVGDLCTIVIKTRVIGHNSSSSENHDDENYRLEVCNMGQIDHTPVGGKKEKGDGAKESY